jgi:hypothetical protein
MFSSTGARVPVAAPRAVPRRVNKQARITSGNGIFLILNILSAIGFDIEVFSATPETIFCNSHFPKNHRVYWFNIATDL